MTDTPQTRRDTIALALVAASAGIVPPHVAGAQQSRMSDATLDAHRHDWDWLTGSWRVRHSRLKARLVGSSEWQDFDGTCVMIPTLNGLGNMDDNWLDLPAGAYRAMSIRAFNPETRLWSIWWLDERSQTIDPPVRGGFSNGMGEFTGTDTFEGRPIIVRFRWTDITATSAHWEQAFSADAGATWEINWRMNFARA